MNETNANEIRPSQLFRAWKCPASVRREAVAPIDESENEARDSGTRIHAMIAKVIREKPALWPFDETADGNIASWCIEWLQGYVSPKADIYVEQKTPCKIAGIMSGTADVVCETQSDKGTHIKIIDWKTGRLDWEYPASDDPQLWAYALSVIGYCRTEIASCEIIRVHPRLPEERRITRAKLDMALLEDYRDTLATIPTRAFSPDAPACPGESQCKYCRAKIACEEFGEWTNKACTAISRNNATELAPAKIAELLRYRPAIAAANKRMDEIVDMAIAMIEAGKHVPGWITKPGARRKEIIPARALPMLRAVLGDEKVFECVTLPNGKIEQAVADVSAKADIERGQKPNAARAKRDLWDNLFGSGAVEYKQNRTQLLPDTEGIGKLPI